MMQYTVIFFIVVVVLVAILAQLELESEPLIAQRSATLSSDKHETFRMVTDLQGYHKVIVRPENSNGPRLALCHLRTGVDAAASLQKL